MVAIVRDIRTYIYIITGLHTRHMCTHRYMSPHLCPVICTQTHLYIYIFTWLHSRWQHRKVHVICTHRYMSPHSCPVTCTHTYIYIYTHIYVYTCVYIYIHIYIHVYMYIHTYISTHTHTHTHIYALEYIPGGSTERSAVLRPYTAPRPLTSRAASSTASTSNSTSLSHSHLLPATAGIRHAAVSGGGSSSECVVSMYWRCMVSM
jgi:hypothetical protein